MNNKSGVIGSTLTWVTAFLIISFIMVIFIGFTAGLSAPRFLPGGESSGKIIGGQVGSFEDQKILFEMLKSEVEYGGKKMSFHDFILIYGKLKGDVFFIDGEAQEIIKNVFEEVTRDQDVCMYYLMSFHQEGMKNRKYFCRINGEISRGIGNKETDCLLAYNILEQGTTLKLSSEINLRFFGRSKC